MVKSQQTGSTFSKSVCCFVSLFVEVWHLTVCLIFFRLKGKESELNRKVTDYFPVRRSCRKSKAELKVCELLWSVFKYHYGWKDLPFQFAMFDVDTNVQPVPTFTIVMSRAKCGHVVWPQCEKQRHIDDLLRNGVEDGLKVCLQPSPHCNAKPFVPWFKICCSHQVKCIDGKGRGIFADRSFQKDQFVVEYHGDLLEISDAKARESQYAEDPSTGCYMYYFRFHDKTYWWVSEL